MNTKALHISKSLELPLKFVTSTAAILATRGEGKTHIGKVLAEEMINVGAHVIVGDPTGVWWGLQSSASGKRAGLPVVVFGGDHADIAIAPDMGRVVAESVVGERINAILDMSAFDAKAQWVRFMADFAERLYRLNKRPVHIFLDEADEFVPQNPERDENRMLSLFKRIWQRGRVKGIGGTILSQRPAVVNSTLRNISATLIALKTVGPHDRKALGEWIEAHGTDEEIAQFKDTISRLEKYRAWWWSHEFGLFETAIARKLHTFDSSATPEVDQDLVTPTAKSQIDIKYLTKALGDAVDRIKADDPELLRKEIKAVRAGMEFAQLEARELRGHQTRLEALLKAKAEQPAFGKRERQMLQDLLKTETMIERSLHSMSNSFTVIPELQRSAAKAIKTIAAIVEPKPAERRELNRTPAVSTSGRTLGIGAVLAEKPADVPVEATNGAGLKDGAQRRLLVALAQHGALAPGRLRVVAGIGSIHTFRKYIGQYRTAGLVASDPIEITEYGRQRLGAYDPLPTGPALIDHWKRELGPGILGKIFGFLLDHRQPYDVEPLAAHVGTESLHTMRKYIGRLRTFGLVEYVGTGQIQISQDFDAI